MKVRYRLTRRGSRGNTFYCVDSASGRRTSLQTEIRREAQRLVDAKNEAENQPALNLQIAKAFMIGADSAMGKRIWGEALGTLTENKQGANRDRWQRASKDKALASLLPRLIVKTRAEMQLGAIREG